MKKLILIFLSTLFSFTYFSQDNDQKGKEVLKLISEETNSYQSMKIDFKINIKSPDINESKVGIAIIKDNIFYYTTEDREVRSDDISVWTYMKEDNECYIDNIEDLSDGLNPSEIMTIWENKFKIKHLEEIKNNNEVIHRIKLFPIDIKSSKYHTIILKVNETKKQIINATIKTKDGITLLFVIKKLSPNTSFDENIFKWNASKHPDVEIIDNR